ncbi:MAG: NAD(P)/FAD-dependent oxidoreductase [Cyanobacteriota bacterium]
MMKIAIIGAGPAGLTAAYVLAKAGFRPEIWEADPLYVGGISRTVVYKGFRFDIGGHRFFSKSSEIEDLWSEILPSDMIVRERLSRILYQKKFYQYPLEASEVISNLGKSEALLCIASYLRQKLRRSNNIQNLEDWVTHRFGHRLYRTFFKTYTEKVWGTSCRNISADWAAQRIKGLSLSRAAWASLFSTTSPPTASSSTNRQDVIKTLITSFRYPRLGPGMMWEAAATKIQDLGGILHMDANVTALHHDQKTKSWSLSVKMGQESFVQRPGPYHHVISSAPLRSVITAVQPALPASLQDAAASLRYRDFILVALILRSAHAFPDQWLYIHDTDLLVGRIQNFGNWSPDLVPDPNLTCYGMEYFCTVDDDLWSLKSEDLIQFAIKELEMLQLARSSDVLDGCVVKQPKAYPVYDNAYGQTVENLRKGLAEHCPGLHQVGRNGMHRYNNQDHSMMTGMLMAKNIISGDFNYDPWLVNQDAEYIESKP